MLFLNYQLYDNDIRYAGGTIEGIDKEWRRRKKKVLVHLRGHSFPVVMRRLVGGRFVISDFADVDDFELFFSEFYRAIGDKPIYNEFIHRRNFYQYLVALLQFIDVCLLINSLHGMWRYSLFPYVIRFIILLPIFFVFGYFYRMIRGLDIRHFRSFLYNEDGTPKHR